MVTTASPCNLSNWIHTTRIFRELREQLPASITRVGAGDRLYERGLERVVLSHAARWDERPRGGRATQQNATLPDAIMAYGLLLCLGRGLKWTVGRDRSLGRRSPGVDHLQNMLATLYHVVASIGTKCGPTERPRLFWTIARRRALLRTAFVDRCSMDSTTRTA